jgi:hypothetical protein
VTGLTSGIRRKIDFSKEPLLEAWWLFRPKAHPSEAHMDLESSGISLGLLEYGNQLVTSLALISPPMALNPTLLYRSGHRYS